MATGLTLNHDVHTTFDTLRLWLEPVETVSNFLLVSIRAPTRFPGHTQHLQTLCTSFSFYPPGLEAYCNIHNPESRKTSRSITSVFGASCCMLQDC